MNAERRPVGFGRRLEDATRPPTRPHVPDGAVGLDDAAMQLLIPKRDGRGHKGTFGKVLVVAGALDYAGAGLLVCRAAGRGGAGRVTLARPASPPPPFPAQGLQG